jgi:hypothetical protein
MVQLFVLAPALTQSQMSANTTVALRPPHPNFTCRIHPSGVGILERCNNVAGGFITARTAEKGRRAGKGSEDEELA